MRLKRLNESKRFIWNDEFQTEIQFANFLAKSRPNGASDERRQRVNVMARMRDGDASHGNVSSISNKTQKVI